MVVWAVSEKCQACHCMITEFRLVWEQRCANAEVFQNPTLLIWYSKHSRYFKYILKISTGINGHCFNEVKAVLSLSVLSNLGWWYGLGDREADEVVQFGEGASSARVAGAWGLFRSSTAVQFLPSSCTRYLWCSSSSELPFGQQVKYALSVFWKEGFVWICERSMVYAVWICH